MPAWLAVGVALLIALVAAGVIAELRREAAHGRRAELALSRLEGQANRLSALEWQAIAQRRLDAEVAEGAQGAREEMSRELSELGRLDVEDRTLPPVVGSVRAFDGAVAEQLRLLEKGRIEEALEVDEEKVDPSYEALREELDAAGADYGAYATQKALVADVGSVLTLGVAGGLVGLLSWRFLRSRRTAELMLAEQKALRKSQELFRYQALHDALTGLPNRVLLRDRLQQALARSRRNADHLAVLMVDLDDFKYVNDSLGHEFGDKLLVEVARHLRESLRAEDTAARLGGDEFAVIVEGMAGREDAPDVARRIIGALRAPFVLGGQEVFVKASVGIAAGTTADVGAEELLRRADVALYEAKKGGKDGYSSFDAAMDVHALGRIGLENELRRAIERGEFRLHYQPKVMVKSGALFGFEALLRWEHPERGLVPPLEFIPIAEETGLIIPIGQWVLEEACRQASEWQAGRGAGVSPLVMSVNVSPRQVRQPDLAGSVARVLRDTGLRPQSLTLEVTENVLMENVRFANATFEEVRAMGVRIAVDDFGTGYSSLSRLKELPVDTLKIDRSFVQRLGESAEDETLVSTVIGLAQALGLSTVAEGVETAEHLALLETLGCDMAQGYYFARPLEVRAASEFLASWPDARAAQMRPA